MAIPISDAGVIDGQIIYAVHVTRIVDALTGIAQNTITIDADLIQGSLTNTTNSTNSHAEGEGTTASGNYSHAEGKDSSSTGTHAHAEGFNSIASGDYSHAEGSDSESSGDYSHAEGLETISTGDYSHASGYGTIAYSDYQAAVGRFNLDLNNDDYFVVGVGVDAGNRADGLGINDTRTYISNSLLLPDLSEDTTPNFVLAYDDANKQVYFSSASAIASQATAAPPDKAIQFNSASLFSGSGYFIYDYNLNSFAHGSEVLASGPFSHAQGSGSAAIDTGSHAEGYYTEASGAYSHTEGSASKAYGIGSHAEGSDTRARGSFSHAEGSFTLASASWSHAEGVNTEASGTYSHAEGRGTLAIGEGSHTEGRLTIALGDYSHAEGRFTTASGQYSHASGFGTSADDDYQTALGRYNVTGNLTDVFVVGVGSAGALADGFGVSTTRTYISNSLFLPDLTNSSKPHVLAYDSASKQVYFAPTSSVAANAAPPDKAIQFNSGNTFSGSANFIYDYGINAFAHGSNFSTSGPYSYVGGSGSANGSINYYGFVHGLGCYANGIYTVVIGRNSTASDAGIIVLGEGLETGLPNSILIGQYNVTSSIGDMFTIGVGVDDTTRKNGFGINNTRAYISTSLELPTLTNSNPGFVLSYNTASKQVNYIPNPSVTPPGGPNTAIQFNSGSTFSGSAKFTFDYNINRTNLTGSMIISGSSPTASLVLYGSGSSNPIFRVQGTQGELLVVTDVSSGSLFSVNDISGLPILDVYSDNTVLLGSYTYPAYHTSDFVTTTGAGAFKLGAIPTSSYDGGYFEYVVKSGSNARSGHITSTWDGTTVVSSSISSSDIGSTSGLTLFVALSSSYAVLSGSAPGAGWTIKSIIRAI